MQQVVIISFDLIRPGEINQSFAINSLLAYAKQDQAHGEEFIIHTVGINLFGAQGQFDADSCNEYLKAFNFSQIDTIAISAYIWNEHLINPLIA